MTTQPEALRLADALSLIDQLKRDASFHESCPTYSSSWLHAQNAKTAASVLCVQHKRITDLHAALERKDALLKQALEALGNSRSLEPVDVNWVKGERRSIIAAITSELAK